MTLRPSGVKVHLALGFIDMRKASMVWRCWFRVCCGRIRSRAICSCPEAAVIPRSSGGVLQVDGYPGFERLGSDINHAACWAHGRRKFYNVHQATSSPIADETLRRVTELYAIEASIHRQTATKRQGARKLRSLPLATTLKA